ncbi:MAG: cysteine--tRNA ligase [Lentisphaeria bacterium]|nr:cysteine--tRNA ligase [Lentisphaeria bacterium]
MGLRFYNSLTRTVDDFKPLEPGKAGLYTCGPTVYNYAHIGNFRAYVFEDLLRRALRYCGYKVTQVMNLTDVDDKTIRDSQKAGMALNEFTAIYKKAFFEDMEKLGIEPAEHYPAATDHIGEMIGIIKKLVDGGFAYVAEDGSVYFSIASYPDYGRLVTINPDEMRSSGRVKHDEYAKESVADFALWKAYDEADGDVAWDSPWGKGRPGWHIECSAMSMKYLGETFDIHTGGVDNMFPHHEDEIAQSEAANGCAFVNYWLHCAHLVVNGEKMSKSAGNFYTLREVLAKGFSGREVRWVLLTTHYRQQLNFSFQACHDARASLQRVDDFIARLKAAPAAAGDTDGRVAELIAASRNAFQAGVEDDLNISAALAGLFNLVRGGNRLVDEGAAGPSEAEKILDCLRAFDTVLGALEVDKEEDVPADITALAHDRQTARQMKDFARADTLRDELAARGWIVEDTAQGPRCKRA